MGAADGCWRPRDCELWGEWDDRQTRRTRQRFLHHRRRLCNSFAAAGRGKFQKIEHNLKMSNNFFYPRTKMHQKLAVSVHPTISGRSHSSWTVHVPQPSSHARHSNVSNWIGLDSSAFSASALTSLNATSLNTTASCHYRFKINLNFFILFRNFMAALSFSLIYFWGH